MNNQYEKEHLDYVRKNAAECTVLLKRNDEFPLKNAGKIALYGSGARLTVKGGTGSGEVNSRTNITIEEGLKATGFHITTKKWLDDYDQEKKKAKKDFMRNLKVEAKEKKQHVMMHVMGRAPEEPEYDLPIDGDGDTALYILSRISGEGADRKAVHGDILLSKTEVRDILTCKQKYKNFMLVLNVGGPVDLSPVKDVSNILVLSQLGTETGYVLADIILGKQFPSGKLTTTWAKYEDYPQMGDFGEKDNTNYREGIYVGYRYFDSVDKQPLFPFGYGCSFTSFESSDVNVDLTNDVVKVSLSVKNSGNNNGKEVVQLYVSLPSKKLDEPYQVLSGFQKTKLLTPGESQEITVSFSMRDIAPYDENSASYILEEGDYILRIGTSSRDTKVCGIIKLDKMVTVLKVKNILGKPDFTDYSAPGRRYEIPEDIPVFNMNTSAIVTKIQEYKLDETIDPRIEKLNDDQLIKLNLGAYKEKKSIRSIIGNAGFSVAGAAGQSCMEVDGFPSLVMADGPAGLRLSRKYAIDKKGEVHALEASIPASLLDFMSKPMKWALKLMTYRPKKGEVVAEQYATMIPIGTAIAQSFNLELAEEFGRIVGKEMELFGVHLFLAPALNIHRSILCGRNFEYYSEDPLVSGMFAGALTMGLQSNPHTGTTIKHFAFNNQERNRTQNNSIVSERAAREIYLKGFGICIKMANPKAVMTSYNLVNGVHTNERYDLINDVLRNEFGFKGIVMTDWIVLEYVNENDCQHPNSDASHVCMAGGDLFMPGSASDFNVINSGLQNGEVTRKQLMINASRLRKMCDDLVDEENKYEKM